MSSSLVHSSRHHTHPGTIHHTTEACTPERFACVCEHRFDRVVIGHVHNETCRLRAELLAQLRHSVFVHIGDAYIATLRDNHPHRRLAQPRGTARDSESSSFDLHCSEITRAAPM